MIAAISFSRRNAASRLGIASVLVPTVMVAVAYSIDRRNTACFDDWGEGQQWMYGRLLLASPILAAGLSFTAVVVGGRTGWRYPLAVLAAVSALLLFGIAIIFVAYLECA